MGGGYLPNQNEIFYQNKQAQEAREIPEAEAEKAQEVPTPVNSRIVPRFERNSTYFPDEQSAANTRIRRRRC